MISRTQITMDPETQKRARRRAQQMGVSFAEYVRRLVLRDLGETRRELDPSAVFDLGRSEGDSIAREKDHMVGRAVDAERGRKRLRGGGA